MVLLRVYYTPLGTRRVDAYGLTLTLYQREIDLIELFQWKSDLPVARSKSL